jgi:hypothetical protein
VGEKRLAGEQRCDQSGERRKQQHAPAPEGQQNQKAEPDQDAEKP